MQRLKSDLACALAATIFGAGLVTIGSPPASAAAGDTPAVNLTYADYGDSPYGTYTIPVGGGAPTQTSSDLWAPFGYNATGDLAYDFNGQVLVRPADGGPTRIMHAPEDAWMGGAFDTDGNLYLATSNAGNEVGYIEKVAADGTDLGKVVTGIGGYVDGIAVDKSGNMYVSLVSGQSQLAGGVITYTADRVLKFAPDGTKSVLATDTSAASPRGIAVDSLGNVFVAEFASQSVYEFKPDATGSSYTQTMYANASYPDGLAIDAYDNIYVTTEAYSGGESPILEYPAGSTTPIDIGTTAFSQFLVAAPPAPAPSVQAGSDVYWSTYEGIYNTPKGSNDGNLIDTANDAAYALAVDGDDNYYAASCAVVTKYTHSGVSLGVFGTADSCIGSMALDNEGDIFAATVDGPIVELPKSGGGPVTVDPSGGSYGARIAVDNNDNVYVYNESGNVVEYAPGTFAHTTILANAQISGLAFDSKGDLWTTRYTTRGDTPSVLEYPAGGGAAIDFTHAWQTAYGTFDPSDPNIGYNVAVDSSDDVYISASLLTDGYQFVTSDGLWEKPAASDTFVQITQSDQTLAADSNGEEMNAIATPHGPASAPADPISGVPTVATAGTAYNFSFKTPGTPHVTLTDGTLPDGLTLASDGSGVISGTTTAAGSYQITVTSTDGANSGSETVTLIVSPAAPANLALVDGDGQTVTEGPGVRFAPLDVKLTDVYGNPIGGAAVQFADTETPHNADFDDTADNNGVTGTDITNASGIAEAADVATLNVGSVVIRATTTGTASSVTFHLTSASPATAPVVSGSPTAAVAGVPYTYQFTATGTPSPTFSATGLPTGFSIDPVSGIVSGATTTAQTYSVNVTATNSAGVSTETVNLVVGAASASALTVVSGDGQTALANEAFGDPLVVQATDAFGNSVAGQSVTFTNTDAPNRVRFASGSGSVTVPTGSDGTATSGAVTALTTAGTANLSVSTAGASSVAFALSVVVPVTIAGLPPDPMAGVAYSFSFSATGTPTPTFAVTAGALPTGLSLDATTGRVAGTTTAAGTQTVTVTATSTNGTSASDTFIFTVLNAAASKITVVGGNGQTLLAGKVLAALVVSVTDAYGNPVAGKSVTFTDTDNPHHALFGTSAMWTATTGTNGQATAGTLTAQAAAGGVTVTATTAGVTVSAAFTETVDTQATLTGSPPVTVAAGGAYTFGLNRGGRPTPTVTHSTGLPPGISLSNTGVFSGSSTVAGTYTFTGTASNTASSVTNTYTIKVTPLAATNLTILGGNGQSALRNTTFGSTLTVKATDIYGNAAPGTTVTYLVQNGGPALFGSSTTSVGITDLTGIATSGSVHSRGVAGPFTVLATSPSANAPTLFNEQVIASTAQRADLSITLVSPALAADNTTFTGTVTVRNLSTTTAASNVLFAVTLPTGVSIQSNDGAGVQSGRTLRFTRASLAANGVITVHITAKVNNGVRSSPTITAAVSSATYDTNPNNNSASRAIKLG